MYQAKKRSLDTQWTMLGQQAQNNMPPLYQRGINHFMFFIKPETYHKQSLYMFLNSNARAPTLTPKMFLLDQCNTWRFSAYSMLFRTWFFLLIMAWCSITFSRYAKISDILVVDGKSSSDCYKMNLYKYRNYEILMRISKGVHYLVPATYLTGTRGPQALTVTWVLETLHWLLVRRAHICISTAPS